MSDKVRYVDFDKRSRNPDACAPRNPIDADVIILPLVRSLNAPDDPNHKEGTNR